MAAYNWTERLDAVQLMDTSTVATIKRCNVIIDQNHHILHYETSGLTLGSKITVDDDLCKSVLNSLTADGFL